MESSLLTQSISLMDCSKMVNLLLKLTKPTSNDVVGLQDLYLQLDTSKSTFDMVSDQIESGIDPSASNYIVSSSYAMVT